MMRRNHRAQEAGYTLIEIVIVVILVGIISALLVPRFVFPPKARLAGRRLAADMQYAKELAIRLQTKSGIYFINNTTYRVFQNNDVNTAAVDPVTGGNFEVTTSGLFSGVTLAPNFGDTIKFNALGTPLDGFDNVLTGAINVSILDDGVEVMTLKVEPNTGKLTST